MSDAPTFRRASVPKRSLTKQLTHADFDDVATLLLWYLKLENVAYVFGVPGAAIATILNRIAHDTPGIEYIVSKHESGGAYMAEGYYRATGHPGVVAVTSGPGAINALTGTLSAQFGGSAVVTITGEPEEKLIGRGVYQEGIESGLDTSAVYDAAVRYSGLITDPGSARTIIQEALRTAMSTPRNAVHLGIPENIAKAGFEEPDVPIDKFHEPRDLPVARVKSDYRATSTGLPNKDDVRQVRAILHWAKRPMIFLGEGCREPLRDPETYNALLGLVNHYQIPVMTTPDGKGLFPENHPLSLRVYGFASCRWPYQWLGADGGPKHDVLLVIGSQLSKHSTENFNRRLVPEEHFIQVDIDPRVIGRAFLVTRGIVADAGAFLKSLSAELSNSVLALGPESNRVRPSDLDSTRAAQIKAIRDNTSPFATTQDYGDHPQYYSDRDATSDNEMIEPAALIKALQEVLEDSGKESMVFIDHANSVGWGTHYFEVKSPKGKTGERPKIEYHQSLGMASMGFGVCPAIGAKLAKKDRICVGLTGDGAFLMHGAEVSTAAKYKVGAIWVVLEDNELNMVTQGMHHYTGFQRTFSYEIGSTETDLRGVAYDYGANAVRVEKFSDLKPALEEAVKRSGAQTPRPQVVVVRINAERVPPYYLGAYKKSDAELSFAF